MRLEPPAHKEISRCRRNEFAEWEKNKAVTRRCRIESPYDFPATSSSTFQGYVEFYTLIHGDISIALEKNFPF